MKRLICFTLLLLCTVHQEVDAQYSLGATGLLNIPTAEMQPDGTFMIAANYIPSEMSPNYWTHNTANYTFNITFFPFVEIGYRCTLKKLSDDTWNQDRAVTIRLRPLKEGRWWPSIVLGSNDAITTSQNGFNPIEEVGGNRYYGGVYAVATKHFNINNEQVGVTAGYQLATQEHSFQDGIIYGLSYRPSFYSDVRFMADVNSSIVSVGAAIKLFNHLSISAFCYDFKTFVGGLRYEVKLY